MSEMIHCLSEIQTELSVLHFNRQPVPLYPTPEGGVVAWATHLLRGFLNLWNLAGQGWERRDRQAMDFLVGTVGIHDAVEQRRQAEKAGIQE